jgi:Sigma 54 modulation protein / S30EA ribosomal protein
MRIQINSDKNVVVDAQLASLVKGEVNRVLKRFTHKLTRVEVHLSDVNSHKPGPLDKRCLVEARPARHRPLTASSRAAKIEGAVKGALTKLRSSLQTFFGRLGTQRAAGARTVAPRTRRTAEPARARARRR